VADGEAPTLDDAAWEHVGLPHSFSMPYFRAPDFYVGDGWYRKALTLPAVVPGRRYSLEFEGAFQDAHVYVNGTELAHHRGGYTGFPVDITPALHAGRNLIAVRVNNEWQATLAPRAGEHVFSGGLYRDVWLVTSDAVHVPWTGTRVTTPDLSAASGKVSVETEVRNDGAIPADVLVRTHVVDDRGRTVATLPDTRVSVDPGAMQVARQTSMPIPRPRLWSPETPALYHTVTTLAVAGRTRDRFETEFGFRWFEWTANRAFSSMAGTATSRVPMCIRIRRAGAMPSPMARSTAMFGLSRTRASILSAARITRTIRISPRRPTGWACCSSPRRPLGHGRVQACLGAPSYPTEPAEAAGFEDSVKQQLAEMIRINRNHPSIVVWGMDNEVYFTKKETMPQVRRLLKDMVALSHQLDPTRPASIDGAQRGEIDKLGDVVGYNGDGASLYPNPGIPNFIGEYGSTMSDRPGDYAPGWDDLPNTPGADKTKEGSWRLPWRSGEAIWAGFDHGSIAGKRFGGMGVIDYFRLPKRQYYWYRNAYAHVAPPGGPWRARPPRFASPPAAPPSRAPMAPTMCR
jgi:beta-galactosidase/beta-glucuronidase